MTNFFLTKKPHLEVKYVVKTFFFTLIIGIKELNTKSQRLFFGFFFEVCRPHFFLVSIQRQIGSNVNKKMLVIISKKNQYGVGHACVEHIVQTVLSTEKLFPILRFHFARCNHVCVHEWTKWWKWQTVKSYFSISTSHSNGQKKMKMAKSFVRRRRHRVDEFVSAILAELVRY